jgi:HEPN domain-containing protein
MDEAKKELLRSWLLKSRDDLAAARLLAKADPPILGLAVYHCQQAAEKALKGFILFNDQLPDKTHDVLRLVERAITWFSGFAASRDAAERLTPHASLHRYPSPFDEPTIEQFEAALSDAVSIVNQVLALLPAEVHPDSADRG